MSSEERQAFMEFMAFLLRYISRHGTTAEQAAVLEHWQAIHEAFGD